MKSRTLSSLLFATTLSFSIGTAHAVDIKLGHVLAGSHSWHIAAEGFAKDVKE